MKTHISVTAAFAILAFLAIQAGAQSYTVAYTNGSSWNTVFAQGFSTSLGASPDPGLSSGDPVGLNQFQFFKSGTADSAANIQLAIFNTMYPNTTGLTTSSSSFVGLSANTIASTSSLNTGDAITFSFNNLALSYDNDYSAYFVNVGAGGTLTPVLVSALTANYSLQGDGNYHPVPNYGTDSQYQYTTGNFISGGYLSAFSYAGDADFSALLTPAPVPEPGTLALLGLGLLAAVKRGFRPAR
jgi:hypothetical protein